MELTPFPHVIVDGLFEPDVLRRVVDEFPPQHHPGWRRYSGSRETGKHEGSNPALWGSATWETLAVLGSQAMRDWLSDQFGMPALEADTTGGGYHMIPHGGRLDMHTDFNRHPLSGAYRRLNGLLYLNEGWAPEDGGGLLLGTERVLVEPLFGRFVAFETSETSWHGHPDPWTNQDRPRRSLAVYYYSQEPPPHTSTPHSTLWLD